jgi:hypothetical protein
MWKNTVERGRPQMTIWHTHTTCWITKATHTHTPSLNIMFIAFLLQQWLHKHAFMLRYTHITCLLNVLLYLYVKVRLSLRTLWRRRRKWRYSPLIYGLCTRWRWVVTFKTREIGCVGSRTGLDELGKYNVFWLCWDLNHDSLVIQLLAWPECWQWHPDSH